MKKVRAHRSVEHTPVCEKSIKIKIQRHSKIIHCNLFYLYCVYIANNVHDAIMQICDLDDVIYDTLKKEFFLGSIVMENKETNFDKTFF